MNNVTPQTDELLKQYNSPVSTLKVTKPSNEKRLNDLIDDITKYSNKTKEQLMLIELHNNQNRNSDNEKLYRLLVDAELKANIAQKARNALDVKLQEAAEKDRKAKNRKARVLGGATLSALNKSAKITDNLAMRDYVAFLIEHNFITGRDVAIFEKDLPSSLFEQVKAKGAEIEKAKTALQKKEQDFDKLLRE